MGFVFSLKIYLLLFAFPIVALEKSDRYVEAAAITVAAVVVLECTLIGNTVNVAALKGKSAVVQVFSLEQATSARADLIPTHYEINVYAAKFVA